MLKLNAPLHSNGLHLHRGMTEPSGQAMSLEPFKTQPQPVKSNPCVSCSYQIIHINSREAQTPSPQHAEGGVMLVQACHTPANPVAAGQQRFQQMVAQLLAMGFDRSQACQALLKAHTEGAVGDSTLLKAIECLTQAQDSAIMLS